MKASFKKALAAVAAAATALCGMVAGAGTAVADTTASTVPGTLTITAKHDDDDIANHALTAYKIAAYNSGYEKDKDGNLNLDTFKYVVEDSTDEAKIVEALKNAHVTATESAAESAAEEGLKQVAGQSAKSPWGYKDTGNATERQFAEELAKLIADGWKPSSQTVYASAAGANNQLPEGLYLIIDKYTPAAGSKSTQSVPMLVGTTFASLTSVANESLGVGSIEMKNTEVPVTKQVVQNNDPTKPYTTPSYSLGDKVTFELSTTIPDYAGYTKNPTNLNAIDARKLVLTDTFETTEDGKIPFSNPTVADDGVKLYRNDGTKVTEVTDGVLTKGTDYYMAETKTAGGSTVTGMTFDFGKLVNGDGNTAKKIAWQAGDVIKVVLTVDLNKDAYVTDEARSTSLVQGKDKCGNANSVKVDFSDHTTTGHHEVNGPTVNVYSFKFNLVKQDKKNPSKEMQNAQFTIKDSNGNYLTRADGRWGTTTEPHASNAYDTTDNTVDATKLAKTGIFVTNSNSEIDFDGLKADKYTVSEVKAPKGYFQGVLPTFTVDIAPTYANDTSNQAAGTGVTSGDQSLMGLTYKPGLDSANGLVAVDTTTHSKFIVNNVTSITQLPKTGAAGIAFFSFIGVALIAAAAFFAIRARKAAKLA